MKYPLATQTDITKMALVEMDDVPLSNPSFFVKKDARGECIGPPEWIKPTGLDFWRTCFICTAYRGPPRSKIWDGSPRAQKVP
jgi:hypothetical protein